MANTEEIAKMSKAELVLNRGFYRKFNPDLADLFEAELKRREQP